MKRAPRESIWLPALLALAVIVLIPVAIRLLRGMPVQSPAGASTAGVQVQPAAPIEPAHTAVALVAETPPAELASALGPYLVYGETDASGGLTTVWVLNAADFSDLRSVTQIEHLPGYPPGGRVSPDGALLAVQRIPPGVSEQAARSNGGEVWVIQLDGSGQRQVAAASSFVVGWKPDSSALVYGARVPLDDPQDPQTPYRTDLIQIDSDGSHPVTLLSDAQSSAITPLGWSAGGQRFYTAQYDGQAGWNLSYWDASSQQLEPAGALPPAGQVRGFTLAPGGEMLLLNTLASGEERLQLYSLADGAQQTIAVLPTDSSAEAHLSALWSADGQQLLVKNPSEASARLLQASNPTDARSAPFHELAANQNTRLTPLSWSPDGAWIALRDYTDPTLPISLQSALSADLLALPRQDTTAALTLFGWMQP